MGVSGLSSVKKSGAMKRIDTEEPETLDEVKMNRFIADQEVKFHQYDKTEFATAESIYVTADVTQSINAAFAAQTIAEEKLDLGFGKEKEPEGMPKPPEGMPPEGMPKPPRKS